jgi:hypothetical protein
VIFKSAMAFVVMLHMAENCTVQCMYKKITKFPSSRGGRSCFKMHGQQSLKQTFLPKKYYSDVALYDDFKKSNSKEALNVEENTVAMKP